MAVINTNVKALFSQAALRSTERSQSVAMQQLSTGKRINSARDDAAGMAIATRMTHQIRSLNQAVRNAGDAITLIQTAEGATNEITDMLQRMRELAIQAVNDTNDNAQRSYLDLEFQQLKQEIVNIAEQTEWNGFPVLSGEAGERVGEMPVYKAISNSQFGQVFVSPTTKREVTGVPAGETQVFKFDDSPKDGAYTIKLGNSDPVTVTVSNAHNMNDVLQQLKTGIAQKIKVDSIDFQNAPQISKFELPAGLTTGTGAFVIAGVSVDITDADATSVQNYAAKVKETLEENGFSAADGRNVAVDPDTGAITITFGSAELSDDVDDLLTFGPTVNTSMPEDVQLKGYQLSVTFNSSQLDSETGLANALTITDPDDVDIEATVAEFKSAIAGVEESWGSVDGAYVQSGSVSMELTDKGIVVAKFVDNRNNEIPLEGVLHPTNGTVTFSVDQGRNREVMSRDLTYTFSTTSEATVDIPDPLKLGLRNFKLEVDVRGGIPAMSEGDLVINDVPIGQSVATDDLLSPAGNAAGSAIAKAAAINRKAVASGITTGETQTLTLTGAPLAADLPRDMMVAGVNIRLTDRDNTSSAVAAAIATQLQASSLFAQNTGRVVSYQPGSTMVTVKFSENEGDVANMAIEKLPTGLTPVVATTIPHLTTVEGTGVFAKVNENVLTGQAMTGSSVVKGVIMINGYASAEIGSVFNNPRETRANTVKAINMIADKTGVRALDTGSDTQGITLVAADGRNIELHFETNDKEFGQRIGMREGVQAATISLESKIQAPVILSTRGDVTTTGFAVGNYTKNESVFNTAARPAVVAAASQVESIKIAADAAEGDFSVTVNGTQFTYTAESTDKPVDIRNKLMSLINQKSAALGVSASAGDTVGDLRLTANVPGIPFKMSAAYPEENAGMTFETVVPNTPAAVKALTTNDLMINGVKIRATMPADDLLSSDINTSSDKSSSAIAMANAINSQSNETGVYALANGAVSASTLTTTANSPLQPGQYSLFVNGVEVSVFLDPIKDKLEDRLNNVAKAINQRMGTHGVTATINDKGALTLTSDGRNMSVWFDSTVPGLSASSFGLDKGGAKAQETTLVADSVLTADETATIQLNGQTIKVKGDGTETVAALLKERLKSLQDAGEITNMDIQLDAATGTLTFKSTVPGSGFTLTGANSSDSDVEMTIATAAGKENSVGNNDVVGIYKATATSDTAKTLYGTVRLTSDPALLPQGLPSPVGAPPSDQMDKLKATGKPFTVTTGVDGFSKDSNFSALGFEVGKFGGQSSAAMDPPKVGRLAFQVGASSNQMITIDLADFGKNGSITSEITGDVDLNVDSRAARINTRDGATSVLTKLDVVMDRINATRATMGAVMNRLDHVINNLTNVSMNLSASRSQIEDADYAQASTNLAKTQIMQQAATAVLAQANTSQQSVMKLLGG